MSCTCPMAEPVTAPALWPPKPRPSDSEAISAPRKCGPHGPHTCAGVSCPAQSSHTRALSRSTPPSHAASLGKWLFPDHDLQVMLPKQPHRRAQRALGAASRPHGDEVAQASGESQEGFPGRFHYGQEGMARRTVGAGRINETRRRQWGRQPVTRPQRSPDPVVTGPRRWELLRQQAPGAGRSLNQGAG